MNVGDIIRRERKSAKLTQKKLGELSGINEVQIRNYELGKANPKYETLQKIADALMLPIEVFFENQPKISIDPNVSYVLKFLSYCGLQADIAYKHRQGYNIYDFYGADFYLKDNVIFLSKHELEKLVKQVEETTLNTIENYLLIKKEFMKEDSNSGYDPNSEDLIFAVSVNNKKSIH